jgi:bifunctional DNA-binding transcriptional regulator/antitoxin component of YhaV-PrlF toxin-antitoxin module
MTTLTVTTRGQVTFRKKVLQHLGIKPGEKIAWDLLPDGRGVIRAARPMGRIQDFFGVLAGKTKKVATIEEMNEAAARGSWKALAVGSRVRFFFIVKSLRGMGHALPGYSQ